MKGLRRCRTNECKGTSVETIRKDARRARWGNARQASRARANCVADGLLRQTLQTVGECLEGEANA